VTENKRKKSWFRSDKQADNKEETLDVIREAIKFKGYEITELGIPSEDHVHQSIDLEYFRWTPLSYSAILNRVENKIRDAEKNMFQSIFQKEEITLKEKKAHVNTSEKTVDIQLFRKIKVQKSGFSEKFPNAEVYSADDRGRICLGSEYGDKRVKVLVIEAD